MDLRLPTPLDLLKAMLNAIRGFFFALAFLLIVVPLYHWGVFAVGIALVLFGHRVLGFACVAVGLIALCVSKNLRF